MCQLKVLPTAQMSYCSQTIDVFLFYYVIAACETAFRPTLEAYFGRYLQLITEILKMTDVLFCCSKVKIDV